jgi:hypothetical protein
VDRAAAPAAAFEIASRETPALRIEGVDEAPPFLRFDWAKRPVESGEPIVVRATLLPSAPLGSVHGRFLLRTNVEPQALVAVEFAAQVFADIVPDPSPVPVGLVRIGEVARKSVQLRSRTSRPFRIASVTDPDAPSGVLALTSRPCQGTAALAPCQILDLALSPTREGTFGGTIRIAIEGEAEPIPLVYSGVAVAPGTEIKVLEAPPPLSPPSPSDAEGPRP